jgi:hypothetical protein
MGHEPSDHANRDKTTRADARLKAVKAADAVAVALREFAAAIGRVHPADALVLAEGYPLPNLNCNIFLDTTEVAYAAIRWASYLHHNPKWEDLGTKRFPDSQSKQK